MWSGVGWIERRHLLTISLSLNALAALYILYLRETRGRMSRETLESLRGSLSPSPRRWPQVSLSPALLPSTLNCSAHWAKKTPWLRYGCWLGDWEAWALGLNAREGHVYSQNGEDGITLAILDKLGHGHRRYLEFGVEDGRQCNTRILRERHGWSGVLFDNHHHNPSIGLYQATISLENVMRNLRERGVPMEPDLFSLDINYADWFMLRRMLKAGFRPRVTIVEFNRNFDSLASVTVDKASVLRGETWTGSKYFGASLMAFAKLMRSFGYSLLAVDSNGVNAFFARDELIGGGLDLSLVAWVRRMAEKRKVGTPLHSEPVPHPPHQHICLSEGPCEDTTVW